MLHYRKPAAAPAFKTAGGRRCTVGPVTTRFDTKIAIAVREDLEPWQ